MNTKRIFQKIVTLLFIFLPIFSALAQEDNFPDDVQDVPAAPIDGYVWLAIFAALFLAFRFFKKQRLSTNSK